MIAEMERAIYKRDNIEAKGKVATQRKGAPPTQAVLAKQVADVGKKLQQTSHDANLTHMNVLKLQEAQAHQSAEVQSKADEARELSAQLTAAQEGLASSEQMERVQAVQLRTQSKIASRLTSANEGGYEPTASAEALREQIAEADDTAARLLGVVEQLQAEHPQYASVLSAMVTSIHAARP